MDKPRESELSPACGIADCGCLPTMDGRVVHTCVGSPAPKCAYCGEQARGNAGIDGKRYCHEAADATCYMLASWEMAEKLLHGEASYFDQSEITPVCGINDCDGDHWPQDHNACAEALADESCNRCGASDEPLQAFGEEFTLLKLCAHCVREGELRKAGRVGDGRSVLAPEMAEAILAWADNEGEWFQALLDVADKIRDLEGESHA